MIYEIDMQQTKSPTAKVAICQIALQTDQISFSGISLPQAKLDSLWKRVNRTLKEVIVEKPNVIQFPECSIPYMLIDRMQEFSVSNNVIIIAGTHYVYEEEGYISRCPIIFPNGDIHYSEKIVVSPFEKKPIRGEGVISGQKRLLFRNTIIGTFIVYICSDFLHSQTQNEISIYDPDLVFVSAFQPTSKTHYFNKLDAACGVGLNGCYCLYSNTLVSGMSDGCSSLFGITDRIYQTSYAEAGLSDLLPSTKVWQAKSDNDYVIAELDLETKKPELPKRVQTKPNIDIIADRSRLKRRTTNQKSDKKYKLAVFDMDGTLIRGIVFSWVKLWELCGDDGKLWRSYLNQYQTGNLEYSEWCHIAVKYFREAGLSKDIIFEVAREQAYLVANLESGLLELKSLGFKTALVSGGVDIFMMSLIPNYRNLFDHNFINRLHFDGEDIVSTVTVTPYDFDGKAKAIENLCSDYGFDKEESIFVGDYFNDTEALKKAGYGIVFGDSEDGVKHVSNYSIDSEDFNDVVAHIKHLNGET